MRTFSYVSLVVLTTLLMGIAFPIGKIGISYAPPFLLMGVRLPAGRRIAGHHRYKKTTSSRREAVASVSCNRLVPIRWRDGRAYYSMRWISSGESSIITCTTRFLSSCSINAYRSCLPRPSMAGELSVSLVSYLPLGCIWAYSRAPLLALPVRSPLPQLHCSLNDGAQHST